MLLYFNYNNLEDINLQITLDSMHCYLYHALELYHTLELYQLSNNEWNDINNEINEYNDSYTNQQAMNDDNYTDTNLSIQILHVSYAHNNNGNKKLILLIIGFISIIFIIIPYLINIINALYIKKLMKYIYH